MKRTELLRRLARKADENDVEFVFHRHGGSHDLFRFGRNTVVVPRHREVEEMTAPGIVRDCDRRGDGRR
ncbi:hypothetical protein JYQ29_03980 [Curtobacterium flaccumfaciens pv. flaccumfaciens]|uniref:hypothetical protein n=1 Tax=Curtobacterium flaccumfaciens TaxID=2035 RepID=UPI001ADD5755|nr:hypothetical protein [Curtobacterium flaccumfaciens]MBO9056139.1 hypothetical protein [Curtobacterium flaccumfaciens pv. flaccumfaciens]QVG66913.1 hypothetical protein JG551_000855 [Curtobacterium flaccumfaciens pv. flaccumfaciens]